MITFNIITGAKCGTVTNTFTFVTQLFYILFWSWLLNKICEKGYSKFSWFLFLMPIVTSGVVVSIIAMSMVLGEDMYQLLEEEKAKEAKEDEERKVEPMIFM
jgi:ABC-type sugar transport system permease subunit